MPNPCSRATPRPIPGLRTMIGWGVPHFRFANSRRATKYTSAGKGVRSLKALPMKSISNGMLAVAIVCRPGPNTSRAFPSRKKTADWLSRTITCDPIRKSPMPASGNRWTISSFISFGYSMTSKILAMVRLLLCCRPQPIIADAGIAYKRSTDRDYASVNGKSRAGQADARIPIRRYDRRRSCSHPSPSLAA